MSSKSSYRIGIVDAVPWSYKLNGEWKGFCIDLIQTLAKKMDFDFRLILSQDADTMGLDTINEGILHDIFTEFIPRFSIKFTQTSKMKGSKWCVRFMLEENLKREFGVDCDRDDVQNVEIKLENMIAEGYQSEILIGRYVYKDKQGNENQSKSFVVKIFPTLLGRSIFTEVTFANEIYVFSKVIPFFKTMNNSVSNLFAEFYCGRLDFNEEGEEGCVVMENLQESDFRLTTSKVFLDIEHLTLAMKKLGEFHAYSYQAKNQSPEKFYSVLSCLRNSHYTVTRVLEGFTPPLIEYVFHLLSTESSYYEEKVREMRQNVGEVEEFVAEVFTSSREPTSVLCHGDFLRNNLMFKYDEKNLPIGIKFIDVGNMYYSTPIVDLGLILYMNTDQDMREEYWDTLIDVYYDSLKNTFPENNLVPSKDEILEEFKYNVLAPCFLISTFLPWMLATEEINNPHYVMELFSPEYEEYKQTPFAALPIDVHINITKKLFQPHRTEKVLQMYRDIINRGFV